MSELLASLVLAASFVLPEFKTPQYELYFLLGDNEQSQMIRSEFERDWSKPSENAAKNMTPEELEKYKKDAAKYIELRGEVAKYFPKVIFEDIRQYPNTNWNDAPYFRLSKRHVWEKLDQAMFKTSSFPLVAFHTLGLHLFYDASQNYCSECIRLSSIARNERMAELKDIWEKTVQKKHPEFADTYGQDIIFDENGLPVRLSFPYDYYSRNDEVIQQIDKARASVIYPFKKQSPYGPTVVEWTGFDNQMVEPEKPEEAD